MAEETPAAPEVPDFTGTYKLVKNENFEEFLAANGAPWIARKMAGMSSATLTVTQTGKKFTFSVSGLTKSKVVEFTLDEDYEETQHNGVVMKVQPRLVGKDIVLSYEPKDEYKDQAKPQTHTRSVDDNKITVTLQVGDVTAKRIFHKTA